MDKRHFVAHSKDCFHKPGDAKEHTGVSYLELYRAVTYSAAFTLLTITVYTRRLTNMYLGQ